MTRPFLHQGHILGLAALLAIPVAVFAHKALAPLFAVTAVASLGLMVWKRRAGPPLPRPFAGLLVLVLAWGLLSAAWSITPGDSAYLTLPLAAIFFGGLVLAAAALRLAGPARRVFEGALCIGVSAGFALLAVEVFSPIALTRLLNTAFWGRDIQVDYTYANYYKNGATVAAILLWPTLAVLWRRGMRTLAAGLFGFAAFVILKGGSGAGVLGLAGGVGAFAVTAVARTHAWKVFGVILVAGVLALPFAVRLIPPAYEVERALPLLPNSAFPRIFIWQSASDHVLERPVLGLGLDTARAISKSSDKMLFSWYGKDKRQSEPIPLHTHNAVLQVWVELGAVGALLLLAVLFAIIRAIAMHVPAGAGRAACYATFFAAFAVANVSYGFWHNWWQGALWLAAVFAAGAAAVNTDTTEPSGHVRDRG